jgi:hypothetical protein
MVAVKAVRVFALRLQAQEFFTLVVAAARQVLAAQDITLVMVAQVVAVMQVAQ